MGARVVDMDRQTAPRDRLLLGIAPAPVAETGQCLQGAEQRRMVRSHGLLQTAERLLVELLGLIQTALSLIQTGQGVEAACCRVLVRTPPPFAGSEHALVDGFRFCDFALVLVETGELICRVGEGEEIVALRFFLDRQGALEKRFGGGIGWRLERRAAEGGEAGQAGEHPGDFRVIRPEHPLADCQCPPEERLRLVRRARWLRVMEVDAG
jgi:hypothetical protein